MSEKFDPKDEKYKEVADLPPENQEEFMDVKGGGFVSRGAIINSEMAEETAHKEKDKKEMAERKVESVEQKELIELYKKVCVNRFGSHGFDEFRDKGGPIIYFPYGNSRGGVFAGSDVVDSNCISDEFIEKINTDGRFFLEKDATDCCRAWILKLEFWGDDNGREIIKEYRRLYEDRDIHPGGHKS